MTLSLFPTPETDEPTPGPDVAYTPDALARAIVAALKPHLPPQTTLSDPHAGGGAFLRAFARHGYPSYGAELDPVAARLIGVPCADFTRLPRLITASTRPVPGPLAYIGNPPFSTAEAHVLRALSHDPVLIAWILPSGWGSRDLDWQIFRTEPYGCPSFWPIQARATFTGPGRNPKGSAMTDTSLVVWSRKPIPPQRIFWR